MEVVEEPWGLSEEKHPSPEFEWEGGAVLAFQSDSSFLGSLRPSCESCDRRQDAAGVAAAAA